MLGDAWASAVDGTGGRGLWLTLAGPYGERTLLAAVLSDELGLLDFSTGAMPKKRIDEQLRAVQAESPLPWVTVPARWAWATLVAAAERARAGGGPVPPELGAWIERLGTPAAEPAPVYARLPAEAAEEPALLERSAALLALPELAGWFLDPASVSSEALEWLQARESRLVVSEQIKAERLAALIDRIIETPLRCAARRRWQGRLEDAGLRPPGARADRRRRGAPWPWPARSRTPRPRSGAFPSCARWSSGASRSRARWRPAGSPPRRPAACRGPAPPRLPAARWAR